MKAGIIGLCVIVGIMGFGTYYFYTNQYDALLLSGNKTELENIAKLHEPIIQSSTIYEEKLDGSTNSKIHAKVRILSKTTAEKLMKDNMLQKEKKNNKTEPITSLPNISEKQGLIYSDSTDSIQQIEIKNQTLTLAKGSEKLGIGVGKNQETQEQILIVDDLTYKNLPLKENTFQIIKFNFISTISNQVTTIKSNINSKSDIECMKIKTKK